MVPPPLPHAPAELATWLCAAVAVGLACLDARLRLTVALRAADAAPELRELVIDALGARGWAWDGRRITVRGRRHALHVERRETRFGTRSMLLALSAAGGDPLLVATNRGLTRAAAALAAAAGVAVLDRRALGCLLSEASGSGYLSAVYLPMLIFTRRS